MKQEIQHTSVRKMFREFEEEEISTRTQDEIVRIYKLGSVLSLERRLAECEADHAEALKEKLKLRKTLKSYEIELMNLNNIREQCGLEPLSYQRLGCYCCGTEYIAQFKSNKKINYMCTPCSRKEA